MNKNNQQTYQSSDSAIAPNLNYSVTVNISKTSHRGTIEVKARPPVPLDPTPPVASTRKVI
jgi:hypothetical protein